MLMYSELGGFADFPEGKTPAGWVDGEPVRKALLDAKRGSAIIPEVTPQHPQDTPKRRPGRPPNKVVENASVDLTDDN